jgi:hypothetical protein
VTESKEILEKDNPNYEILPEHMREEMRLWIEDGIAPGDFLWRILTNNFVHAFLQADIINSKRLFDYAKFLWEEAPNLSWGSEEKCIKWYENFQALKEADHQK